MKKALLIVTLMLSSAAASGQARVESREGDLFKGPVRSVRTERADFSKVGGAWTEGPRRLVSLKTYSPDGRRSETQHFDADGSLREIEARAYFGDGRAAELSRFDPWRNPLGRTLYSPDGKEIKTFGPDGRAGGREVVLKDASGREVVERRTYDAEGRLLRRDSNTPDGYTAVLLTYGATGLLSGKKVFRLDKAGGYSFKDYRYGPDGSAGEAAVGPQAVGAPRRDHSERREYDARGNLVRQVDYRRNLQTGEMEPYAVTHYEITYY